MIHEVEDWDSAWETHSVAVEDVFVLAQVERCSQYQAFQMEVTYLGLRDADPGQNRAMRYLVSRADEYAVELDLVVEVARPMACGHHDHSPAHRSFAQEAD